MAATDSPERLLRVPDVAERLAVAPGTVRTLIREGLPAIRVGGQLRVAPERLEEWLRAHEVGPVDG